MTGLEIELIWKDDDLEDFFLKIGNGTQFCKLTIYEPIETIKRFGKSLQTFPSSLNDVIILEMGTDTENFCFLRLEAICYNQFGHAALKIRAKDNAEIPKCFDSYFFLQCEAAAINNLGKSIVNRNFETEVLRWHPKS